MKTYPVISLREPKRKPVGFHLSDRNIMLAILVATAALVAMTMGAEQQRADSGYYGAPRLSKASPAKPKPVSPEDEAERAINDDDWGEVFSKCHATPGCEQQVAAVKPRRKR